MGGGGQGSRGKEGVGHEIDRKDDVWFLHLPSSY